MWRVKLLRAVEFVALFGALPLAFPVLELPLRWMFPLLFAVVLASLFILRRDPAFDWSSLVAVGRARRGLPRVLRLFVVGASGLVLLMFVLEFGEWSGWFDLPRQVEPFVLVRHQPWLWLVILLLYPLLSVYPQEVVYRAFFFHRYAVLFGGKRAVVVASAAAFAWAHIVMENVWAVGLCVPGGLLFAWTYATTKSLLAAVVEHALYGVAIFTVGLGWYFYGGAVRA